MIKKLKGHLGAYVRTFSLQTWCFIFCFVMLSVWANDYWQIEYRLYQLPFFSSFLGFFIMYLIHVYVGYYLIITDHQGPEKTTLRMHVLWFLACGIFAFRAAFSQHADWIETMSNGANVVLNVRKYHNVFRALYCVVPVYVIWRCNEKEQSNVYGLTIQSMDSKLYGLLLLGMIPLIWMASMNEAFINYYPRALKIIDAGGNWFDVVLYELFYGLDFVSIELFFRGFMVIGFVRYLGIKAILPMALMYMSIHYGKPLGEAVSSFFGGSLLGVLCFYSRSIVGGIIVHIGIAWGMELGGAFAHFFK